MAASRQPYRGFDALAATSVTAGENIMRISSDVLSIWSLQGKRLATRSLVLNGITKGGGWQTWLLDDFGWRNHALVAQTVPASREMLKTEEVDAVAVLDTATGRVIRVLVDQDSRCGKGGCPVRGWVGDDTVILQTHDRLLGWNIRTGALSQIATLPAGADTISLGNITP